MARIFDSSCGDIYDIAHVLNEWSFTNDATSSLTIASGVPGASGNCFSISCHTFGFSDVYLRKNLPTNYSRLIKGGRFQAVALPSLGTRMIYGFWDNSGTFQIGLFLDASGRLSLWRDAGGAVTQVGTYSLNNTVQAGVWLHIALDITFDNAGAGAFTLYANSHVIKTAATVTTANNANAAAMVSIHSGIGGFGGTAEHPQHYHDDFYVNDTTGVVNNGFDGDIQGLAFLPTGAGRLSQQAISGSAPAATHWQSVNQAIPDDDVTYVMAATTTLKDTCKVAALPANVISIVSVTTVLDAKTDTSGLGAGAMIRPLIGNGTTEANGTSVSVNTSYVDKFQYFGQNPLTSAAWALADWPNIEIGHERTA